MILFKVTYDKNIKHKTIKHWRGKNWALGGGASWTGSFHHELSMFQSSCDGVKGGRSKDKRRLKMRHQPTDFTDTTKLVELKDRYEFPPEYSKYSDIFCIPCSSSSPNILNILIFFVHLVVNYHDHPRWLHAPLALTIILFATLFVCYVDNILSKFWISWVYLLLWRTFILYSKYIQDLCWVCMLISQKKLNKRNV